MESPKSFSDKSGEKLERRLERLADQGVEGAQEELDKLRQAEGDSESQEDDDSEIGEHEAEKLYEEAIKKGLVKSDEDKE